MRRARQNEAWARASGAAGYGHAHYPLFFVLHPAWLLRLWAGGRANEGEVRWSWLLTALTLQPLRYWIMHTLGKQWNTHILIVPNAQRVTGGPFRYFKHPKYMVVVAERLSAPLSVGAARTAFWASLLNAALLLLIRIPAENRALEEYGRQTS